MKKLIQTGLLALAFLASGASAFADTNNPFKIATFDLHKAFDTYYKTIQASLANSNSILDVRKQLNDMYATRNKRETEYHTAVQNANDMAISAEERARYKKSAEDIGLDLQIQNETITNYIYRSETHLHDDMVQHVTNLTAEIRGVMKAMAKKQGYTLVLDSTAETATGNPLVLYSSGENDLTEAVIKELNSAAPLNLSPEAKPPGAGPVLPIPEMKMPPAQPVPK